MPGQRKLQLVEDKRPIEAEPRRVTEQLWSPKGRQMHSLHYVLSYRGSSRPEVTDLCIRRFSRRGDTVLDPCCGRGTALLQAALLGRTAWGVDSNPLAVRISRAKLNPVGLDEVVLRLNQIDFRRPVDLTGFQEWFSPFFHPDTYRELVNLRSAIGKDRDVVSLFIELLTLSRLHGHTNAYCSAYSFPQVSLPPKQQAELNIKRRQLPEFRAVAPRLIRKAAEALRDGFTSDFHGRVDQHRVETGDARSMPWVPDDSVKLVVTALPSAGGQSQLSRDLWLELWFSGISRTAVPSDSAPEDMLAATLAESLRVVSPQGYVVLEFAESDAVREPAERQVADVISNLSYRGKKFQLEEILLNERGGSDLGRLLRTERKLSDIRHYLLVLRCIGTRRRAARE